MWPCGLGALVCSSDVNSNDEIPVLILHVLEGDISENTSIVDEDIDAAEAVNGSLNDPLSICDTVIVCDGLSAGLLYFLDNDISCLSRNCQPRLMVL